ncbi:MAG: hypothetical protein R2778_15880 [Saprospiraceae bacterium]
MLSGESCGKWIGRIGKLEALVHKTPAGVIGQILIDTKDQLTQLNNNIEKVVIELDLLASAAIILYGEPKGSIPRMCLLISTQIISSYTIAGCRPWQASGYSLRTPVRRV